MVVSLRAGLSSSAGYNAWHILDVQEIVVELMLKTGSKRVKELLSGTEPASYWQSWARDPRHFHHIGHLPASIETLSNKSHLIG